MKKALVIGYGFIGQHLIKQLKDDGYYTIGIGTKQVTKHESDEYYSRDMRDKKNIEELFDKFGFIDEVYLLAFVMGGATFINCGANDAVVMSDSATICLNVVNACVNRVGKLFFSSSACVYPENESGLSVCKESTVYPANPSTEYGWTKIFIERLLLNFRKQYGLNICIARLHSIVGEGSIWSGGKEKAHSALAAKVVKVEDGGTIEVLGDGSQIRTFLHVSDCISGIIKLMRSNCQEIINIGSDTPISINEYIEILKKVSNKTFYVKYVPGPTGVRARYCDISLAKTLIDWYPTVNIEEATKRTYNWIVSRV
jgi:nucleoside-diphosphate-sugar epimerase